jgi:hypothetical protein
MLLIAMEVDTYSRGKSTCCATKDGWAVKGAGNKRATKITETKTEATKLAREISQNQASELIVHGKNGRIQSRDSHEKIRSHQEDSCGV